MERSTVAAAGLAAGGIACLLALAHLTQLPLCAIPFATSIVLAAGSPLQNAAAPRAVALGHLTCALVGMAARVMPTPTWISAVSAVAVAVALMRSMDALHPPAGITPLILLEAHSDPWFLLVPIAGGIVLTITIQRLSARFHASPPTDTGRSPAKS